MNLSSRIESYFSQRYDSRPALYLPSGRFGIWMAARHWLPRSARVLVSPVNCDQVVYALLSAGMKPVFGPVNPATGNLDARALTEDQWRNLDAVLTTNLYGVPDDVALLREISARHGVVLIEDVCHAFDSASSSERIGSSGVCAVFSLAKHLGGQGGVLLFREESDRDALKSMMREGLASPLLHGLHSLTQRVRHRLIGARSDSDSSVGHRSVFQRSALDGAMHCAPNITAFDAFLGSGGSSYRCFPSADAQSRTLAALENWDNERDQRREQVAKFIESGLMPRDFIVPDDTTLLRVPLFVENREAAIASLGAQGIRVSLVYDPPLHEHFPWIESIGGEWTPARARWCRDVLPIEPQHLARMANTGLAFVPGPTLISTPPPRA